MPIAVGLAIVALSGWQVISSVIAPSPAAASASADLAAAQGRSVPRALSTWAGFAVAVALLKPLGFLLTFALLTLFLVCVMYRRRLATGIAVAVLSTIGFHLVFVTALRLKLPAGPLGF